MEQSKLPLLVDDLPHSWFGSLSASWEEMSTYIVNTWTILLPLYWAVFTHHYCIILYILNISSTNIGTDTYYPINHNRKRDKITSVQLCIVQSVALLSSDPFSNHTPKWPGAKWGNPSVPMSSAGEQPLLTEQTPRLAAPPDRAGSWNMGLWPLFPVNLLMKNIPRRWKALWSEAAEFVGRELLMLHVCVAGWVQLTPWCWTPGPQFISCPLWLTA